MKDKEKIALLVAQNKRLQERISKLKKRINQYRRDEKGARIRMRCLENRLQLEIAHYDSPRKRRLDSDKQGMVNLIMAMRRQYERLRDSIPEPVKTMCLERINDWGARAEEVKHLEKQ